jgi:mRNA interferase MazF
VKTGYYPRRGDLIWLNFTPRAGHEEAGRRPAFVISQDDYNRKVGLLLACPVTSRAKGYPFEVALPVGGPVSGVILADQVRSMDWKSRQAEFIGRPDKKILGEILSKLGTLIEGSTPE